ncbi:uncharacterized protein LOC113519118 [Galleria mellonella]|uniref:Uncharacterized protein LOC113519118 n=1 Tax=Galleria mellonella TaxID=7137 RepID=A0A6J1X2P9_GALME|nr:uncharacterized protein LOC113519118 [Galleria mellonella]
MCGVKLAYLFVFSALSLAANAAPNALNNEIRNLNWRNSRNIRNIQDLQNLQKIQSLRDVLNLQDEATIINGQVNADLRNIDLLNRYGPQSPLNIIDRRDIVDNQQNGVESFTSTDVVDITDIQQPGSESIQVSESIRPSNILDTNQRLDLEGRPTNVVDIVDIQRPGSETSQVTETVSPTNDLRSELRTGSLNNLLPGYPRRSSLRPRPVRPLRSARLNSNRWGLGPNVGRRGLVSPVNSGSLLNSLLSRPVSQNWNNEPIRLLGSRSLIEDRVPSVYQRSSLGVDRVNSVLGSGRTVPELDRVNTIVGSGQSIRSLINNRLSSGYQRSPLNIDRVNSVVGSGQTVRSLTDDRVPLGSQIPPVDVERIDTIIGQPSDNVVIVTNDIERPGSSGSSTYPTYGPRSTQDLEVITSERIVNGSPVLSSEEVIVGKYLLYEIDILICMYTIINEMRHTFI